MAGLVTGSDFNGLVELLGAKLQKPAVGEVGTAAALGGQAAVDLCFMGALLAVASPQSSP